MKREEKMEKLPPYEDIYTEFKESNKQLTKDLWETVSAFANTYGGNIYLGVKEIKHDNYSTFIPVGIPNAKKQITDFLNNIKNKGKISSHIVHENDISILHINGKEIVKICVPKASYTERPIYLDHNIKHTYIREGTRDSEATEEDLKAIIRDSEPDDNYDLLDNFTIQDDLKLTDIQQYKANLIDNTGDTTLIDTPINKFLYDIGLIRKDRKDGQNKLTKAALLLFGKFNSITDIYNSFMLDFIIKNSPLDPNYTDRIYTSNDKETPDNIFGFWTAVSSKLETLINNKFDISGMQRKDSGKKLLIAIREGLANCLVHADYQSKSPTKISFFKNQVEFLNHGEMLISPAQFFLPSDSKTRNDLIFQSFIKAGIGEHTGSGGYTISKTTSDLELRKPEIETSPQKTKLVLWKTNEEDFLKTMPKEWQSTYKIISNKLVVAYSDLSHLYKNRYQGRKILKSMEDAGLITQEGEKKGTKYLLSPRSPKLKKMMNNYIQNIQKSFLN